MRSRKQRLAGVLAVVMAAFFCISPVSASEHEQELEDAKNKISDYENALEEVQALLESLEAQTADLNAYIQEMDALQVELNTHIYELDMEIQDTQLQIETLQEELEEAEELSAQQYEDMKRRIQYMYEFGTVSYLDIFMRAGSIADMFNQIVYIMEVSSYDREKLNEYEATVQEIETASLALQEQERLLTAQQVEYQNNLDAVQAVLESKNTQLQELYGQISVSQSELGWYQTEIDGENEYIEELEILMEQEAEAARIAAIEAAERAAQQAQLEESRAESQSAAESIEESLRAEATAEETLTSESESESESETETGSAQGGSETGETSSSGTDSGTAIFTLVWPVPSSTYITSYFGPRPDAPIEGVSLYHNAIDIAAAFGSAIVAAADGIVIYAGDGVETNSSSGGYQVWIAHESGKYITMYMHCSLLLVQTGDTVQAGETIAQVGSTGLSTGNHLDFRILYGTEYIDPLGELVTYIYQ